jgi:hypothetical protein
MTGNPCPTVIISPPKFYAAIKKGFDDYFMHLLDPQLASDSLRRNFKKKFLVSYGIDIGNEP